MARRGSNSPGTVGRLTAPERALAREVIGVVCGALIERHDGHELSGADVAASAAEYARAALSAYRRILGKPRH